MVLSLSTIAAGDFDRDRRASGDLTVCEYRLVRSYSLPRRSTSPGVAALRDGCRWRRTNPPARTGFALHRPPRSPLQQRCPGQPGVVTISAVSQYRYITENRSNRTPDSRRPERPLGDRSEVHRTDGQSLTTSETDDETPQSVLGRLYRKRLLETLQRAVRNGYNGVDVVHLELQSMNGLGLDVWQATRWETEPQSTPEDHHQRYDFRYYDRASLLASLSDGEWPGTEGGVTFRSRE